MDADVVTSLDTDQWGNVYAAAPQRGRGAKFSAGPGPVAELRGARQPARLPRAVLHRARPSRRTRGARVGSTNGVAIDQWTDVSGVTLWNLGVEVADLAIETGDAPAARFATTDRAEVTLELADRASGRVLARRAAGTLEAGAHRVSLNASDLAAVAAVSAPVLQSLGRFELSGWRGGRGRNQARRGAAVAPRAPCCSATSPNPVKPYTRILFALPDGATGARLHGLRRHGRARCGRSITGSPPGSTR